MNYFGTLSSDGVFLGKDGLVMCTIGITLDWLPKTAAMRARR
jgi:hypothetical protein